MPALEQATDTLTVCLDAIAHASDLIKARQSLTGIMMKRTQPAKRPTQALPSQTKGDGEQETAQPWARLGWAKLGYAGLDWARLRRSLGPAQPGPASPSPVQPRLA